MLEEKKIEVELQAMKQALLIRNYAAKTVSVYVSVLKRYLIQLEKSIAKVRSSDSQEWQYSLVKENVSWTLFNQMVCALRFYFSNVRKCNWSINHIPFQRKKKKLPSVLCKEDVLKLIDAAKQNPVLLGHANIHTTALYLHVATHHLQNVQNPLDNLCGIARLAT